MNEHRVLRWSKAAERGDGWSPIYEAHDAHGLAGSAVRTGRYGADDYQGDWGVIPLHEPPTGVRVRRSGEADTRRSAKEQPHHAARRTREPRPPGPNSHGLLGSGL